MGLRPRAVACQLPGGTSWCVGIIIHTAFCQLGCPKNSLTSDHKPGKSPLFSPHFTIGKRRLQEASLKGSMARGPLTTPWPTFKWESWGWWKPSEATVDNTGRDMGLLYSLESAPYTPSFWPLWGHLGLTVLGERIIYLHLKIFPVFPTVVGLSVMAIKIYFSFIFNVLIYLYFHKILCITRSFFLFLLYLFYIWFFFPFWISFARGLSIFWTCLPLNF